MINLFTSYYIDPNPLRQGELDLCLKNNIKNKCIDNIYLITEEVLKVPESSKVKRILIHERPTFNVIFEVVNSVTFDNDINIISNSDIYFDNTLCELPGRITNKTCFALTRYDVTKTGTNFLNRRDSQDSFFFKGKIRSLNADFCMGVPGCDNALCHKLKSAGYMVENPSLTFKSYHIHNSEVRTYKRSDQVPQPYLLLTPTR